MYDFEALQVPIDEELQGRTLHFKHAPATLTISSNLHGHTDPIFCTATSTRKTVHTGHSYRASRYQRKTYFVYPSTTVNAMGATRCIVVPFASNLVIMRGTINMDRR